jgi:hypothetical protein
MTPTLTIGVVSHHGVMYGMPPQRSGCGQRNEWRRRLIGADKRRAQWRVPCGCNAYASNKNNAKLYIAKLPSGQSLHVYTRATQCSVLSDSVSRTVLRNLGTVQFL